MRDDRGHQHDTPEHRQGEGKNKAGDEAINRQRNQREADKHRDDAQHPADQEAAEQRHSAAHDRVLAAEYEGQDEVDADEIAEHLQAKDETMKADLADKQRQQKAAEQKKR